jgi:YD repeat-containing protein
LPIESRLPAKPEGTDAHTTKIVYYSAQEQSPESACRNKPAWANPPCKVLPAAQASPVEGNPQLLVKRVAKYSSLDKPEEVIESAGGSEEAAKKRTTTVEYDSVGRPKWRKTSGGGTGGTSIPAVETLYNSSTGAPETQQFVCLTGESCPGLEPKAVKTTYDKLGRPIEYKDADGNVSGLGKIVKETNTLSTMQYAYDKAGRLTQAEETPAAGSCTTRSYSFEADSNRTALTTHAPGAGGICEPNSTGTKQSYSYDTGDRLLAAGITYDNFGRITSLPAGDAGGSTLTTSYFSNDMVASQSQGAITNTFQLDAALRQRQRTQTGGGLEGAEVFHYAGETDSPAWTQRGSTWTRNITGIGGELAAVQEAAKKLSCSYATCTATSPPPPASASSPRNRRRNSATTSSAIRNRDRRAGTAGWAASSAGRNLHRG